MNYLGSFPIVKKLIGHNKLIMLVLLWHILSLFYGIQANCPRLSLCPWVTGCSVTDRYRSHRKLPNCCFFDSGAEVWIYVCTEFAGTIQVITTEECFDHQSVFLEDYFGLEGGGQVEKLLEGNRLGSTYNYAGEKSQDPDPRRGHLWGRTCKNSCLMGAGGREDTENESLMPSLDNDPSICLVGN